MKLTEEEQFKVLAINLGVTRGEKGFTSDEVSIVYRGYKGAEAVLGAYTLALAGNLGVEVDADDEDGVKFTYAPKDSEHYKEIGRFYEAIGKRQPPHVSGGES
jgi:hypothetical protein